jgi:phenylalanyl-tRNA synthetase beta chain
MASLVSAANQNEVEGSFHLFEMANVYLPRKNNLPEEKMTLAGIFHKTDFREAKGLIEALLDRLNVSYQFVQNEKKFYAPSRLLDIKSKGKKIGELGILEDENLIYYEFNMEELRFMSSAIKTFRPMAQYPAQVEDITLTLPERTRLGDVLGELRTCSRLVSYAELTDSFKNSYTFRVHFQHPQKTLTNEEVIEIRNVLLKRVREKFGAILKS